MAPSIAAFARGLFLQQVEPVTEAPRARISVGSASASWCNELNPIDSSRVITVGPTPFTERRTSRSFEENGIGTDELSEGQAASVRCHHRQRQCVLSMRSSTCCHRRSRLHGRRGSEGNGDLRWPATVLGEEWLHAPIALASAAARVPASVSVRLRDEPLRAMRCLQARATNSTSLPVAALGCPSPRSAPPRRSRHRVRVPRGALW